MQGEMWEPWTHARSSLSSLSEEHSSRLNHQPHVKATSGSGIAMECTLLPPVAWHRIELLAYLPVATEKERGVTMLSTWRKDYPLCIISFTFILPSNLKSVCWPGQIPFKIFQPEMDYYIQQPQHLRLWRGKEAASLFPCFLSPLLPFSSSLLKYSVALLYPTEASDTELMFTPSSFVHLPSSFLHIVQKAHPEHASAKLGSSQACLALGPC